jgi:hypothetical protein
VTGLGGFYQVCIKIAVRWMGLSLEPGGGEFHLSGCENRAAAEAIHDVSTTPPHCLIRQVSGIKRSGVLNGRL